MTDIIFIVDGCERSKACQASIKFFFESLKTSLCKEYIYIYISFFALRLIGSMGMVD